MAKPVGALAKEAQPSFQFRIGYFGLFCFGLQAVGVPMHGTPMEKSIHTEQYAQLLTLLRSARDVAGVTQVELASRLNATQTFISKCERGERRLDIVELKQWCEAIGLSLVELAVRFEDACNKRA